MADTLAEIVNTMRFHNSGMPPFDDGHARQILRETAVPFIRKNSLLYNSYTELKTLADRVKEIGNKIKGDEIQDRSNYDAKSVSDIALAINAAGYSHINPKRLSYGNILAGKMIGHAASVALPTALPIAIYALVAGDSHVVKDIAYMITKPPENILLVPEVGILFFATRLSADALWPLERLYNAAKRTDRQLVDIKHFLMEGTEDYTSLMTGGNLLERLERVRRQIGKNIRY